MVLGPFPECLPAPSAKLVTTVLKLLLMPLNRLLAPSVSVVKFPVLQVPSLNLVLFNAQSALAVSSATILLLLLVTPLLVLLAPSLRWDKSTLSSVLPTANPALLVLTALSLEMLLLLALLVLMPLPLVA